MNRSIAVLMISILFFNLAPAGFPQAIDPRDQAKADAAADVSPEAWFILGAMVPLGCLIGYAMGTAIDSKPVKSDYFSYSCWTIPNETQIEGALIGSCAGGLILPVSYLLMPIDPSPERFLGKPPEYISAYTSVYERHTRSSRLKAAVAGITVGTCISGIISVAIWENLQQQ